MEFKRICPNCGKELIYKYKSSYDNANKHNSFCRNCSSYIKGSKERLGDLSILLEDTYNSFYWIGYLLADGCFSDYRLGFGQAIKDETQVQLFSKYIKFKNKLIPNTKILNGKEFKFIGLNIQDHIIVPLIKQKFDIKNAKTYNPPQTINKWNRDLILSLFAGFIDGDGSIIRKTNRKDAKLGIKVHSSWLHILEEFSNIIFKKNHCFINKDGYACLIIEEFPIIRNLKLELLKLNIPLLKRKWDKIDENYINKLEKGKLVRPLIKQDFLNGMKRKDICEKYKVSGALLTKILKYDK